MEIFRREYRTITVNGRTYTSVEEMPPDVREQFEKAMGLLADKNNNGIPDAFEGPQEPGVSAVVNKVVTHIDGVTTGARPMSSQPSNQIRPLLQASWSSNGPSGGGGGITLSWPTLIALLATVAVIGAAIMWYLRQ